MDRDIFALGIPGAPSLPFVAAVPPETETKAMQALKSVNGSAEHRIAEVLEETQVKLDRWPWLLIGEIGFLLFAAVVLAWMVWPK
jgi:hypothetical protein